MVGHSSRVTSQGLKAVSTQSFRHFCRIAVDDETFLLTCAEANTLDQGWEEDVDNGLLVNLERILDRLPNS
jgi:hypothetical protein